MMTFEEYCNPKPRYAVQRCIPYGWIIYDTEYDDDIKVFRIYREASTYCEMLNDNANEAAGVRRMERDLADPPTDWRHLAVEQQKLKR